MKKLKNVLMAVAALAALALGGSAIAGAVSGDDATTTQQGIAAADGTATAADAAGAGQRGNETALTGDTATRVSEAAQAEVEGGTVERVETDADGNAAYEAHVVKPDGSRVTVYVDEQFNVVGVEEGPAEPAGQQDGGAQSNNA